MLIYHRYLEGLQAYFKKLYPLTESVNISNSSYQSHIHIYFPEDVNYGELIPLSLTYFILFLYIYFSMRKIEHIKSKVRIDISDHLSRLLEQKFKSQKSRLLRKKRNRPLVCKFTQLKAKVCPLNFR